MIRIRAATPADADALQALYAGCIRAADWLPHAARQQPRFAAVSQGEVVQVAEDDRGRLVGLLAVQPAAGFIHHLYVLAEARSAGVGRRLLAALAETGLPGPWQLKCVRRNLAAMAFYSRLGWREVGGGESEHGAYALLQYAEPA